MRAHLNTLVRGLFRVMVGSATAGCYALAMMAFWTIPGVDGYLAVGDFLIGVTALGTSLVGTYLMGMRPRRKGA